VIVMAAHVRAVAGRTRLRTTVVAVGVAVLCTAALSLGALAAPAAAAAVRFGHDISWPQCPSLGGGSGPPMPPDDTQFVIIGVTDGRAFTENPCLAGQLAWVQDRGTPAHAYTVAGFPTPAQLTSHGTQGPWSSGTRAGRLSNVGYAEAGYAVATLGRVGWLPPVVWLDVEPGSSPPWPSRTRTQRLENRDVLEGLLRGLADAGLSVGVYSNTSGWRAITGGWRLPGVPVWATAGKLEHPDAALDACTQRSFSGGPVYLAQWWDDARRDHDRTCAAHAFSAIGTPPASLSGGTTRAGTGWNLANPTL
jgi:hypothetical protein